MRRLTSCTRGVGRCRHAEHSLRTAARAEHLRLVVAYANHFVRLVIDALASRHVALVAPVVACAIHARRAFGLGTAELVEHAVVRIVVARAGKVRHVALRVAVEQLAAGLAGGIRNHVDHAVLVVVVVGADAGAVARKALAARTLRREIQI